MRGQALKLQDKKRHLHKIQVLERNSTIRTFDEDVTTAEVGKEIMFDPSILDTYLYNGWESVHHDLLLVCAAVEFADCHFARPNTQWCRSFDVTVPVLELKAWQRSEVQETLTTTLRHLTGDDWCFSFIQGEKSAATASRQRSLPFGNNKKFTMAYSDGLDSRCVAGIFDNNDTAVCVRLSHTKEKIKIGEIPFDLVPFQVKVRRRESGVRSRGFKFAAITAIAGHLAGVTEIIVPESGQGALGPVLLPLHNVYADYRNYPTFFRKMEGFVAALLGESFTYQQPRLWYTKGQTISAFLAQPGNASATLLNSRSCWQKRMNVRGDKRVRQCGLCAACLLRRMSMYAAGVDEPPNTYTFADLTASGYMDAIDGFSGKCQHDLMVQYGSVGARHLQQLAELAGQPDMALRRYVFEIARATGASERETNVNLKRLLVQHAEEWRHFIKAQGKTSFLKDWTKGSRYGRSQ